MEGSIIKFLEILIRDPLIKKDYLDCLNQYVLYGNQGRNRSKENQIKKYLTKYKFQGNMETFFRVNLFSIYYMKIQKSIYQKNIYYKNCEKRKSN